MVSPSTGCAGVAKTPRAQSKAAIQRRDAKDLPARRPEEKTRRVGVGHFRDAEGQEAFFQLLRLGGFDFQPSALRVLVLRQGLVGLDVEKPQHEAVVELEQVQI